MTDSPFVSLVAILVSWCQTAPDYMTHEQIANRFCSTYKLFKYDGSQVIAPPEIINLIKHIRAGVLHLDQKGAMLF